MPKPTRAVTKLTMAVAFTGSPGSGWDQLVIVPVDAVAETEARLAVDRRRERDRSHDLADLALPAEEVAPPAHPRADVDRVAMELERPGIDERPFRPRDGRLRGDDVEDVEPPRRAFD